MRKLFEMKNLLWVALLLALIGSLTHVAWGFATLERENMVMGYIQAVAVDVGLFAIAVGIQQGRQGGRSTRVLWGGVLFFAGISTYANLLHGLAFAEPLDLPGWDWLVALRPFLLSAVLPILVVYLAEVAATRYVVDEEEGLAIPVEVQVGVFLDQWHGDHGREPTVPEMVYYFEQLTGISLDEGAADAYVLAWRREHGKVGARPKTATALVPISNGRLT